MSRTIESRVMRSSVAIESTNSGSRPDGIARIYAKKWENAAKTGKGLYVGRSGASGTPLLDLMVDLLPSPNGRNHTVIEAAAGSGDQAVHLATRLRRTEIVAIDTSPHATAQIEERRRVHAPDFGEGSGITVVTGDVLDYLKRKRPGSVDGVHANSFWHFLPTHERRAHLDAIREVGVPGGLVAVSFKAEGDGLLSQPGTEVVGEAPAGVLAVPSDGIQRLFVHNPAAIQEEFAAAGFPDTKPLQFSIPDYDVPGRDGQFYGFLAIIPA